MKTLSGSLNLVFFEAQGDIKCRADYGVSSDDLSAGRSLDIPMTESQKTSIRQFAVGVALPQIRQKEGIS